MAQQISARQWRSIREEEALADVYINKAARLELNGHLVDAWAALELAQRYEERAWKRRCKRF